MNTNELVNALRNPLTMSMFARREHLYQEADRQRKEAADTIERQAEAIRVLREALHKVEDAVYVDDYGNWSLSDSFDDTFIDNALAQTKEFGE